MDKQRKRESRSVGTDSLQANAGPLFTAPEVPAMTPKKSHKKRNIIIAIIALVVLIPAAAFAIYWFATPEKAPTKAPHTTVVDSAESIINKINVKLTNTSEKDHHKATISQSTPQSDNPLTSPSYKVNDTDYYVATTETYGLAITLPGTDDSFVDEDASQAIATQVISVLTDTDYKKTDTNVATTNYESTSVVCSISSEGSPMYVTCANKSAYTKISRDLEPFVTTYTSAKANDPAMHATYSNLTITDSPVKDYQRASVNVSEGIGGATLLFYRHNEDKWLFFTATQNILSCSDYNTVDIVSAFSGEKCMDGDTESTVGATTPATTDPSIRDTED